MIEKSSWFLDPSEPIHSGKRKTASQACPLTTMSCVHEYTHQHACKHVYTYTHNYYYYYFCDHYPMRSLTYVDYGQYSSAYRHSAGGLIKKKKKPSLKLTVCHLILTN